MQYNATDSVLFEDSRFLAASSRKSGSRLGVKNSKSSSSLRGSTLAVEDDAVNGRHSLAHELAVALMPEPSAGSRLLAEEFGIEYDEGAEGIDEDVHPNVHIMIDDTTTSSFSSVIDSKSFGPDATLDELDSPQSECYSSRSHTIPKRPKTPPRQDAIEVFAQNLESTDKFIAHLRTLDAELGLSGSQQPSLERTASDVIRRINEMTRDREGQVRELLECEREFRKIAGEVGGTEALSRLDELIPMDDLSVTTIPQTVRPDSQHILDTVEEEPSPTHHRLHSLPHDWETDPDTLGEENEDYVVTLSPIKDSFPPPPPIIGDMTPGKIIPHFAHLRSFTTSLVSSLTAISEQAQVNGAATTEAGRKVRALKNKLGGWRTDWDSAERSRLKIERWEAGLLDDEEDGTNSSPSTPTLATSRKRIDGRRIVQEHLHAFELALADAALKTQAIMT